MVASRLGAGEVYRHLLQRWLERLVDARSAARDGDAFVSAAPLPEPALDALLGRGANAAAPTTSRCSTTCATAATLAAGRCCAAREPAGDAVSGAARSALADGLYQRSSTMRYVNDLAAARRAGARRGTARAARAARARGRRRHRRHHRGRAAVSAGRPHCATASPTSRRSSSTARRDEFGGYASVDFAVFDLDRTLVDAGPRPGELRLVVASNAVHASRDLRGVAAAPARAAGAGRHAAAGRIDGPPGLVRHHAPA